MELLKLQGQPGGGEDQPQQPRSRNILKRHPGNSGSKIDFQTKTI
jgi:hypothetical protein